MKIDIVTDTFAPDVNGVAMTLGRLTDGLRKLEHRVHVIRTGDGRDDETIVRSIPLPGYREVRVGLPASLMLRMRWRKRRPDAIYVATESPLGKSAVEAAKILGIPVLTGFHTNFHEYMRRYSLGKLQPMVMSYLKRFHERADCTLAPSLELVEKLRNQTFGNVVLEAMASGLVTVAYDYAAAAKFLRHGENGLKADKGDVKGFIEIAKKSLEMYHDHPLRIAAREIAITQGWSRVVQEFEGHLREISNNSETPPTPSPIASRSKKRKKISYRTVFLSDIHLGTPDSKATEVGDFLKQLTCEKLILNGDIIDGWALKRGAKWESRHSRVIRRILKMTEKDDTEVIYLRGNHDEILERFLPLAFGKIRFTKEYIHTTANNQRYLVVHGDGFDSVSTNHKWLAALGAIGYDSLLKVNRYYNYWRAWRGKEYFSLSKRVKAKVKSAVSFVDKYEVLLQDLALHKECNGIICGHIHTPEDKKVGEIHYLNSGDWVESLTAIVEHHDGRLELIHYKDLLMTADL